MVVVLCRLFFLNRHCHIVGGFCSIGSTSPHRHSWGGRRKGRRPVPGRALCVVLLDPVVELPIMPVILSDAGWMDPTVRLSPLPPLSLFHSSIIVGSVRGRGADYATTNV